MIVENQNNLKVHFAGCEDIKVAKLLSELADVKYHLFTIYPFIRNRQDNDSVFIKRLSSMGKHTIMDSGLFTLMFGAEKGKKDKKFLESWTNKIIEFVLKTKYQGTIVEVDCQKVLGVEQAWIFRKQLKKELNNRIINVFHKEDGQKGLDKLIDFSDYIAISVPELRMTNSKTYKKDVTNLVHYIKTKKEFIDIHLLGCTEPGLLHENKHCSSSDSTSWKQSSRWGRFEFMQGDKLVKAVTTRVKNTSSLITKVSIKKLTEHYKDDVIKHFGKLSEKSIENYTIGLICARESLKKYSKFAGPQN